jgi:hypothetical protein
MYTWIWRRLPGSWPGKLAGCFALLIGVLALLFFVVFPWAEPRLPFNKVTVTPDGGNPAPTPTVSVSPGPSPSTLPSG